MQQLKGTPASHGKVRSLAAVHRGDGAPRIPPGAILVTEITDPSMYVQILENAAGIVTELGGITSHPAIIARELGIPCVVGAEGALKLIPDGAVLEVDGETGIIAWDR